MEMPKSMSTKYTLLKILYWLYIFIFIENEAFFN